MKRLVQFIFAAVVIINCSGDHRLTAPEQAISLKDRSSRDLIGATLQLDVRASVQLKNSSGWIYYESDQVPVSLTNERGRYIVHPTHVQALIGSMHEVPSLVGSLPAAWHSESSGIGVRGASIASSTDPEVVADDYAQANYVPANYSDIYIDQATWNILYGGTLSQDISGNGSVIATVRLDPISTINPSGKLHLLLNGVQVATVNPQYAPTGQGYYTQQQNSNTYSYYSGQPTSTATVGYKRPLLTLLDERKHYAPQFGLGVPQYVATVGRYIGLAVLPKAANAQTCHECAPYVGGPGVPDPCAAEARRVVGGIIGLLWRAHKGDIGGVVIATGTTVNFLHDYGRCAASHPEYRRLLT